MKNSRNRDDNGKIVSIFSPFSLYRIWNDRYSIRIGILRFNFIIYYRFVFLFEKKVFRLIVELFNVLFYIWNDRNSSYVKNK